MTSFRLELQMSSDKESFHNRKNSILHNVSVIEDVQLNIEHDTKPVTIVLTMFAHVWSCTKNSEKRG